MGYSPWGHRESDTTEQLTLSLLHFQNCSTRGGPVRGLSFPTLSPYCQRVWGHQHKMTSFDRAAKNTKDPWETSNALNTTGNETRGHSGQLSGNLSVEGPFHSQCVMVTKTLAISKQHKQPETGRSACLSETLVMDTTHWKDPCCQKL